VLHKKSVQGFRIVENVFNVLCCASKATAAFKAAGASKAATALKAEKGEKYTEYAIEFVLY